MTDSLLDETLCAIQAATHVKPHVAKPSICDSWTDSEILRQLEMAPILPDALYCSGSLVGGNVRILCDDTVVKVVIGHHNDFVPESLALDFVRLHTSIPVPLVRRTILKPKGMFKYILLEKIEGTPLDKVWPTLSASQRFGVALTLRDYIRQLRQASTHHPRRHIPGPLGHELAPQLSPHDSWWCNLTRYKPLASSAELIDSLNKRYELPRDHKDRYPFETQGTFTDSHPLVFTHMDLSIGYPQRHSWP